MQGSQTIEVEKINYPKVEHILKLVLITVFMAAIALPLVVLLLFGSAEVPLDNEKEVIFEPPTVSSWLSGGFQGTFESWFSTHYPSRTNFVSFYRQFKYDAESLNIITLSSKESEHVNLLKSDEEIWRFMFDEEANPLYALINIRRRDEIPVEPTGFKGSDAVLIGKSGYLYEATYIDEYYGYTEPYSSVTQEGLVTLVQMLEYINDQLAKRGITMIYLLSSSKASQYADYIPEWYKATKYAPADYIRPYTMLQPLLAESRLNYVDSSELFKQVGLYATFPKTGIHWNHLASFEAVKAVLDMYAEVSGQNSLRIDLHEVIESTSPPGIGGSSDTDIYGILYDPIGRAGSVMDEFYYTPDGYVVNKADGEQIGVVVHGGSFAGDVVNYLRKYRITNSRLETFFYTSYQGQAMYSPLGKMSYDAWEFLLEDIDLVILEQTEQQIRSQFPTRETYIESAGNGFMGSNVIYAGLYYYLQDNEIK